jgi:dihydropyrimidinase
VPDASNRHGSKCAKRGAALQVNSGLMTADDFVRVVSTAVAQTFNIYPRKGVIAAGSDADIIVFDPHRKHTISAGTHHSRIDTNVHEGWAITGKVRCMAAAMA